MDVIYYYLSKFEVNPFFPVSDVEKTFSNEISNEEFMAIYNRAKPTFTDQIIVYCRTGRRSQNAAEILTELGYQRLVHDTKILRRT